MNDHLDREYFEWLCEGIVPDPLSRSRIRTHWKLYRLLYQTEFTYFVRYDENRAADGLNFRDDFIDVTKPDSVDPIWRFQPCSMLELLLGMAARLEFMAGGNAKDWFWEMLENAGITYAVSSDAYWDGQVRDGIEAKLDLINKRKYEKNGRGSFFPCLDTDKDMREVELWYQMAEYVIEDM